MQEVFEKIKDRLREQRKENNSGERPYGGWDVGLYQAEQIVDAVAAEYNNGWIPCSERLPEEPDGRGVWVLTCATSELVESNHFCNGRFYDAEQNGYKIIAWQPLPKPYQPKED